MPPAGPEDIAHALALSEAAAAVGETCGTLRWCDMTILGKRLVVIRSLLTGPAAHGTKLADDVGVVCT